MRGRHVTGGLVLAAFCLSGCVTQQSTMAVPIVGQASAPKPPMVPAGPRTIRKTVLAGTTIIIEMSWSLNPDCSARPPFVVHVNQQPAHGQTRIVTRDDYPHFPAANPRSACNVKKRPAVVLEYTPTAGFAGSDFLAYELVSEVGGETSVNVPITVLPASGN